MPRVSEEERKKQQERGGAYVGVSGQQIANLNQVQQQQQQSQTARRRQEDIKTVSSSYQPFRVNDSENWNYRNATTGMNGEPLPKGALSWDPRGRPYFGTGIKATVKRWGYEFTKDVDAPAAEKWDEIALGWKDFSKQFQQERKPYPGIATPTEEQKQQAKESGTETLGLAAKTFSTTWQAGESQSLLSVPLKAVRVGFTALADILQEPAIKVEQALGAERAALESVGQYQRIEFENDIATFAANLIATPLQAYKLYNFFTSPKSSEEKKAILEQGWNEGRLLYTSFVEPAVRQEYLSRARAGEDPYLLALELENPIAEAAGQLILDPLNLLGLLAKGGKVAKTISDASDLVKESGLAQDARKVFQGVENLPDARALGKLDDFADTVKGHFYEGEELKNLFPQSYKPGALNAAGNQTRVTKKMGNIFTWMSANLMTEGRPVDDIQEYVAAIVNLSSKNLDEVKDGIVTLSHFPSPATHFGDDFLEMSAVLRNVIGDETDVVKFVKKFDAAKGDWKKVGEIGMGILSDGAKAQFPPVSEMKAASKTVESGLKVNVKTEKLAKEYAVLKQKNPGLIRLAEIDELASKPKNAINRFLGNFYFSYQYGVAMRNKIQNDLITLIDAGPGAWFEKGKYLSENAITEKILATHGGQLPSAATGFQSLRKTLKAGSDTFLGVIPSGSALMEKFEVSAAKRVYWKFYRQTLDAVTAPGRALPSLDEFTKIGFSKQQVNKFVRLVKDNYGDVNKALAEFDDLFKGGKVDEWRLFENYLPDHVLRGLDEQEIMDEISVLSRTKDITRDELATKIDDLIEEASRRADGIKYDTPGQALDNPGVSVASDTAAIAKPSTANSTRMDVLEQAARQTDNEYKEALFQAVRKHAAETGDQVPEIEYNRVFINAHEKEAKISERIKGVLDTSREVVDNVRKRGANPRREWAKLSEHFGDAPADLNASNIGDYIYSNDGYYGYKSLQWEQHAEESIDISEGLARQFGMEGVFENAKKTRMDFEKYRSAVYGKNSEILDVSDVVSTGEIGSVQNASDVRKLAERYGVSSARVDPGGTPIPNDKHILNIINKADDTEALRAERTSIDVKLFDPNTPKSEIPALKARAVELDNYLQPVGEVQKYERLEDVPLDVAKNAFAARGEMKGVRIPPPYPDGATPSMARASAEGVEGTIEALQTLKKEMLSRFGAKASFDYNPEMQSALKGFAKLTGDRMAEARLIAQKAGQYWRDFALLPYGETTHLDHAMSYIFPYQFWYSRSYATWAKRLASDPQIIAAYAKIKDKMAALHKDSPEWWKYNVTLPEWMWGLNNNNPMYINLEAAVWPLYGITGTDFNEPRKRVDWLTATVDDMGKFGPSTWAPIQIAMAAMLKAKGNEEAASYWGSRLIPQTATVKSIMALLGKTPVELDPSVQYFSGEGVFDWSAQDQYEQRRTGRQLGALAMEGVPEEQLAEAAYSHSGPLWDEAYLRSTSLRAPGQLASFIGGVGFKARTPEDVEIDKFYSDMHRLMQMREADLISPEDYTSAWNDMRQSYPFMDVMLLSRKAGDLRDEAYAWNVINRIPPGQSRDLFSKLDIDPETASRFYENRGDMSGWSDTERSRFMNAIIEAGAILSIPDTADKNEWVLAKQEYKNMQSAVEQTFGNDIQDRVSLYYGLKDREDAKQYLEANPDVEAALTLQNQLVLQDPVLNKYYGGIDTFDSYYTSQMYDELEKRHGKDITKIAAAYSEAKYRLLDEDLAKQILKENPKLKKYWDDKKAMQDVLTRAIIDFGSKLPEQPYPEFRTDLGDLTPQQQAVINQAPQRSFDEFVRITGEPMAELLVLYLQGEELPDEVTNEFDYLAPKYGYYNGEDMLIQMAIAYHAEQ